MMPMTGRRPKKARKVVTLTPEMIEAGERELIFDSELIRSAVVFDVVTAVLEAGGFTVTEDSGVEAADTEIGFQ